MTDQFVAEIRLFAFNFPPEGWAVCNGQLLPLSQNTALFSLLGTSYGGDGESTFALPNLQGRVLVGQGQGQGLTERSLGEAGGVHRVALQESEMPIHTHTVMAHSDPATLSSPEPTRVLARATPGLVYGPPGGQLVPMDQQSLTASGQGLPHNNLMPYLVMQYCIALQGIFPARHE